MSDTSRPTPITLDHVVGGKRSIRVYRLDNRDQSAASRFLYQLAINGAVVLSVPSNDHDLIDALPVFIAAVERDRPSRMGEPGAVRMEEVLIAEEARQERLLDDALPPD